MRDPDAQASAPPESANNSALYQCAMCKKTYTRVDHLSRHVRSHTQVKPYHCLVCSKQFTRVDLLKRHAAGHDAVQEGSRRHRLRRGDSGGPRVSQACVLCAADHLRCSEQKPCTRCVGKNVLCNWQRVDYGQSAGEPSPGFVQLSFEEPGESDLNLASPLPIAESQEPLAMDLGHQHTSTPHVQPGRTNFPDMMRTTIPSGGGPGTWTPRGLAEFGFQTNIDLNDLDYSFLDAYNTDIPFDFGETVMSNTEFPEAVESRPSPPADSGAAAFRNSHWRFRPNKRDHGAAEQPNLSLSCDHESPESKILIPRRATSAKLTASSRDKVLVMILDSCNPENRSRVVDFFPSAELLDILIQYCLTSQVARVNEFIHLGTLNLNKVRPELLAAVIAYGAVLTADSALSKLGFAIQECVRTSVPKHWERDNVQTRDLELSQAFLIILEIGMWSGNSRKMEIAESFLQPLLTMMRRDGKFRALAYPVNIRSAVEQNSSTGQASEEAQWELWVTLESSKRLILRMLQHDTHVSMALLVPPLISYTEVQLPFPEPQEVWMAESVEKWRARRPEADVNRKPPSLVNFLNDLNCLDRSPGMLDCRHAQFAFLCGAWRLVWEYIQLQSLRKDQPRQWNGLLLESRRDELLKTIEQFRMSLDLGSESQLSPDILLGLELILMHLHTPFEDIQLFAGIDGPEEARQTLPSLAEWVTSSSARLAIWHAGQVLRAARSFPPASLCFFPAVAVYHASLAFWAYGVLLKDTQSAMPGRIHRNNSVVVALDGTDDAQVQRFIQIERGSPAIRAGSLNSVDGDGSTKMVLLEELSEVAKTMVEVFHSNFSQQEIPALVKNLIQLMSGLKPAAEGLELNALTPAIHC